MAKLSERLDEYCALPLQQVPDLEAVLQDIPPSTAVPPPAAPSPAAPQASTRSTVSATAGNSYRQTLQARRPTPASRTPPQTRRRPITAQAARPARAVRPPLSGSPPNPPAPAVSTKDVLDRIREAAVTCVFALKRSAASGELTRVGGLGRGNDPRSRVGYGGGSRLGSCAAAGGNCPVVVVSDALAFWLRKGQAPCLRPSSGKNMRDDSNNEDGNSCRGDYGSRILEP